MSISNRCTEEDLIKISPDHDGNDRYVAHMTVFLKDSDRQEANRKEVKCYTCYLYALAVKRARRLLGGYRYKGKIYKNSIVFTSSDLKNSLSVINTFNSDWSLNDLGICEK